MSNLLRDLLALQKHIQEDDALQKKEPAAEPTNPVSSAPVTPAAPAADTEPTVTATEKPADAEETPVEEDDEKPEYNDSGEFTNEFYSLFGKLEEVKHVVVSTRFQHWMKATDENFSTDVQSKLQPVSEGIEALEAALKALEDELGRAA